MPTPADLAALLAHVEELRTPGRRLVLGIAGAPGCGKSTLAAALAAALPAGSAVVVPMDGFHLPNATLAETGWSHRKGALETFDAAGLADLMEHIHRRDGAVHAPAFSREIDEPVPDAITVGPEVETVVLEGNYLLVDDPAWRRVRATLDATWFLDVDDATRRDRLRARHMQFGRTRDEADEWMRTNDDLNAAVINESRQYADRVITAGAYGECHGTTDRNQHRRRPRRTP